MYGSSMFLKAHLRNGNFREWEKTSGNLPTHGVVKKGGEEFWGQEWF